LAERWRLEAGAVSGTPIVVDGVVYYGDWHGVVRAVNAEDGDVIWETRVTDVAISATAAVAAEVVVVADLGGVVHALDRRSADVVWSTNVSPVGASLFASPVVIEDTVVIGVTDTELEADDRRFRAAVVALDLGDGSERWRLHTDPDDGSEYWVSVWSTAGYDPDRGVILVGTGDTNQPGSAGPGSPSERAGLDLPLADGVLAIEQSTGDILWFYKLVEEDLRRDFDVGAGPTLFTIDGQDVVGAGGKSGDYVLLDRDMGEEIWKAHLTEGSPLGGVMSTAAVADEVIYVASNEAGARGIVFALNAASGVIIWQREFTSPMIGSVSLANGVLYRGTFAGDVVAIDAGDGSVLWSHGLDAPVVGGIAITSGTIYVGFGTGTPGNLGPADGGLVAFSPP
jgi:polyvinyl alcohol dehydrogenase (cytochrome)